MKVVRSWLAEFVNIDDQSDQELAETIENLGHEVEEVTTIGLPATVVVGHVLEVTPHPNADRLRVARVDTGDQVRTIVCGAPNIETGQKVVVALSGTTLPGGLVIEPRAIRGVESDGMICAADELGLSADHSGILVLPNDRIPGKPFQSTPADTVMTLAVTANRGDALSYLGMARELAAKWQRPMSIELTEASQLATDHINQPDFGGITSPAAPVYTLRSITEITNRQLPDVLTHRLVAVGHQLHHPVVDITNYVMEEYGVPLHAFDADLISGPILVRFAQPNESIELLDGTTKILSDTDLVIADQLGPIALAGIMGGTRTAVRETTKNIFLEAAYFKPAAIRQTRTKLGIATSASYRFERGTDPSRVAQASDRAAELIREHLSGKIGTLMEQGDTYKEQRSVERPIKLEATQLNARLGSTFTDTDAQSILARLGIDHTPDGYTIPPWRHDIFDTEDLIEEVVRIDGYDRLSRTRLPMTKVTSTADDDRWCRIEQFKDILSADGWSEHIGSSFLSEREASLLNVTHEDVIKLANPVSEEAAYLRPTQLLSLLKVIAKNPIFNNLRLYEIGTVWKPSATEQGGEQTAVTLVWTGTKSITLSTVPGREFGTAVEQDLLQRLKIRRPIMFAEVPVDLCIASLTAAEPVFQPPTAPTVRLPSKFQPVMRDIALIVDQDRQPNEIAQRLLTIDSVVDVELFDQFTGGKLPQGKQSLAYHLLLEHPERVLATEDIDRAMNAVNSMVRGELAGEIR